jgi:multidrug efflux system membrane fusion protein
VRRYQSEKDMRIEILPDRAGGAVAAGKLVFVDNTVTPQTGTVLLKTRVDNTKEAIWPGQFVNVRVVLTVEPEAVVVPEIAVQPGQSGPFVYLIGAEDKVEIRQVKVSRQLGSEIVIASGVKAGDHVITEIPQALRPGATVRIADPEADGAKKGTGKGGKKGEGKDKGAGADAPKAGPKQ